jgi:hypothetical protein
VRHERVIGHRQEHAMDLGSAHLAVLRDFGADKLLTAPATVIEAEPAGNKVGSAVEPRCD